MIRVSDSALNAVIQINNAIVILTKEFTIEYNDFKYIPMFNKYSDCDSFVEKVLNNTLLNTKNPMVYKKIRIHAPESTEAVPKGEVIFTDRVLTDNNIKEVTEKD